ncbi:PTS fructose transporter subunit IIB [Clostridium polyendosporum]|uniref:PTS fructose transporter subunit IIB n=1 Tax=Clostridium polyendosporum TaxID=69208 RepID=A0A919VNJ7_9CLOT|nr:fructose PTS transporter subunit IIB [Clostridium polyendosporum]GIM30603.1 PTS fructose transporter subunit IIB [Clostridium polyendosporum]
MKKIVGVCACPMGVAHTYLAADVIDAAAKSLGYKSKVETQGSCGIEDKLTSSDIEEAELIVIATAIKLEDNTRFDGYEHKILRLELQQVIKKGHELISNRLNK